MVAPAGALARLKVRVLAGKSASVAAAVKLSVPPSAIVLLARAASTGASFTSLTIMVKVRLSVAGVGASSVTRTVIVFVLGPWASVGVQVKTPVAGFRLAPAGAPLSRL